MMYTSNIESSQFRNNATVEERWVSLKTNQILETSEVIEDITYMMTVTQALDEPSSRSPDMYHRMLHIVSILRSRKKNHHTREKIMAVIHKYLGAVREFLLTTRLDGVTLYQKLFESTMIAIVREVEDIEQDS